MNTHRRKQVPELGKTQPTVPMLVLPGEKASGPVLIEQAKLVATDVRGVIVEGAGHWLMEEARPQAIPQIISFINEGERKP